MSQRHDLGRARIEHLLTADFSENVVNIDLAKLESRRRVNVSGSGENSSLHKDRNQLDAWNTAYLTLQEDETAAGAVEDIGTGIGQTHRQKLQDSAVPQARTHQIKSRTLRGQNKSSGTPRAKPTERRGVGIAHAALAEARAFHASVAKSKPGKPVTRKRVLKQSSISSPALRPTLPTPIVKSSVQGKGKRAESETSTTTTSTSRQPRRLPVVKLCSPEEYRAALQRNLNLITEHAAATASPATAPKATPEASLLSGLPSLVDALPTLRKILQTDELAELETIALNGLQSNTIKQEAPQATGSESMEARMDQIESEPIKQAKEATSLIPSSKGLMNVIPQHLSNFVTVRGDGVCICKFPQCTKGFRRAEFWVKHVDLKHEAEASAKSPPSASPVISSSASEAASKPNAPAQSGRQSLSQSLARQRATIIGEHVYRSRFRKDSELRAEQGDVKTAPLADRTNRTTLTPDHGAAVRAQYADPARLTPQKDFVQPQPPISRSSRSVQPVVTGPALPAFLRDLTPSTDAGAAARMQYSGHV